MKHAALFGGIALAILLGGCAYAEEEGEGRISGVDDPVAKAECSACHIPYPAGFLPPASWKKIITNLSNHFGENASLPPDKVQTILKYYTDHAGSGSGLSSLHPPVRITQLPWWIRVHRYEMSDATLKRIVSRSNCQACHASAAEGMFGED